MNKDVSTGHYRLQNIHLSIGDVNSNLVVKISTSETVKDAALPYLLH